MELPRGYKTLKVERTCQSGFVWAFEFLNYSNVTNNKRKLHYLEEYLEKLTKRSSFESNFKENEFVAVVMSSKRVVRGYTLLLTQDGKGDAFEVFLIDYGYSANFNAGDLRKLPDYAKVDQLPAQSWRIGIYGVLPLHIDLPFGGSASKTVGETWNGKDIQFIANILGKNDTIDFHEIRKNQEYRFGYIYLKDPDTQQTTTLQRLLVDNGYASEVDDFDKVIPSIVRRIRTTRDHVSFPTGDKCDDSLNTTDVSLDKENVASADIVQSEPTTSQQIEPSSMESTPASMSLESQSSGSLPPPKPKGRGRGELMKSLMLEKAPVFQPAPMVGRLPMICPDNQFDDSDVSVYYDTTPTPKPASSRRESISSVEFLTPRNVSPSTSRRQSSSSVEIITPKVQSKIQTISLITPPNELSTTSCAPTIDLTTPTISLITPSPSPHGHDGSGESSLETSLSGSFSRRGIGRGEVLASLSGKSNDSVSMKSANSRDSLTENLSQLKLDTTPAPNPRGRGVLMNRILSNSANSSRKSSVDSITGSTESMKSSRIDFTNDIVPLEPASTDSKANEEYSNKNDPEPDPFADEESEFHDSLITKIMVLGNEGVCHFSPKFSINDFDLHQDVKMRADQLRIVDLVRSQRYMIPAMLTRRNVTLIGPSKGGKTVSCLLALFSLLKDKKFYKSLPVGPGPRAIILCPYSSKCEEIERQCNELNKSSRSVSCAILPERTGLKLNVAYGCGKEAEKDKLNELTQGYDIVICTPSCLLRLLQTPEMMNFKRLCHLVIDDADTLFSSYTDEVIEILQAAYKCGKKCDNGLILPQRVIISKEWIPMIKQWVQKDVTEQLGTLLIASYSEAAIFSNVKAVLRRIDDEDRKRNDLLNYLHFEEPKKSTVIVFNDVEEMSSVYTWLKSKCMRPIYKVGYSLGSADDVVIDWKVSSDNGEHPIMCCTDNTLHDLNIYEANSLIHYHLPPESRGYFTERFRVLLNRLAGPPEYYTPGKMPLMFSKTDTLIYIGHKDHLQFPAVIKLMKKLRMKIPQELQITAEELLRARELEKDGNKFCENYKKFARCWNEKLCKSRHYFSEKYDHPASDIPKRGFIKMRILQVHSASHYSVRLLEHRSGTKDKWSEVKAVVHPGVLNARINHYFSDHSKRSMHLCKKIGEVAAIETTTNMFKRVEVLELKMDDKLDELKTVKVKFIDDGKIDDVRPSVLVKLPDELASIPATAVDIFLCNVLPVDRDIDWGDIISNKVRERIQNMKESDDVHFIGEIQLVSGRDVWIDPLRCDKVYGKEIIPIVSSMCKDLLNKKLAVENPEHLPTLLSLYKSAGLPEPPEIQIELIPKSDDAVKVVDAAPSIDEPENTLIQSDNPEENVAIVSSMPDQSSESDESDEEWVLEDEPQTLAAPRQSEAVPNAEPKFQREDPDSEEDLYDFVTDDMPTTGLDELFDVYFKPGELDEFIEELYPGYKAIINATQPSTRRVTPAITHMPTIQQTTANNVIDQPVYIEVNSEDTTKNIFKPNVEWYQDTDFVYMHILLNVDKYVLECEADRIYFSASYNDRTYEFDELLYTAIDRSTVKHYKSSVIIVAKMEKVIKRNRWPRIFKSKNTMGWIKRSVEHLDDDAEIPDTCWDQRLNHDLALIQPEIPEDFSYISNYNNTNVTIYPEGYDELDRDSDDDSDGPGNDNPQEE